MKILYVRVGGTIHDARILEGLSGRGHEIHYAHLKPNCRFPATVRFSSEYLGYVPPSWVTWPLSMPKVAWSFGKSFVRIGNLIRAYDPDILHATFLQTAGLVSAMTGFHPFVLSPMGSDVLVYARRNWLMRMIARQVGLRADAIFSDSETVGNDLRGLLKSSPDRVKVVPWGIDMNSFHKDSTARNAARKELGWEENKIVIMTRNFHRVYGVSRFLEALPRVFKSEPSARALLVGGGPLEGELRGLARGLGIEGRVRFLGVVSNAEMPKYLNAADAYVSSSLSDGTSTSLLEAMACGLPVVLTDLPSNREWIKDGVTGLLVPGGNITALTAAILRMLNDATLRHDSSVANSSVVRARANLEDSLSAIEAIYTRAARMAPAG